MGKLIKTCSVDKRGNFVVTFTPKAFGQFQTAVCLRKAKNAQAWLENWANAGLECDVAEVLAELDATPEQKARVALLYLKCSAINNNGTSAGGDWDMPNRMN